MDCSTRGFPVLHCLLEFAQMEIVCSIESLCHSTISSCLSILLLLSVLPSTRIFSNESALASGVQSIGASASASVLPMNIQGGFPLGLTGWISLQSRDSQESSPTPQFNSISSLALSLLYGSALTSIHDYWKNHSFDQRDLYQQRDVSAF